MKQAWWRGAVIYQIYPRSFCDSNGDGIGDIRGITRKLDYISKLGVDLVWISPFFKSPMKDFGYDISNYREIDPLFGTMEDFAQLIEKAHGLNIKILIDMVGSHTSDQHPWFIESASSRNNPKADWYVWADPDKNGNVPNNWLSIFGGSSWEWHKTRQQYYLHNFLKEQPDLNFHHAEVVESFLENLRFWLDKGVDGFRLDAINFYVHDKQLRNNPKRKPSEPGAEGVPADNPYSRFHHLHDKSQPENLMVLEKIRQLLKKYSSAVSLGELGDDNSLMTSAEYVKDNKRLHMVYNFRLLEAPFDATFIRKTIEAIEHHFHNDGWPSWSFSNHDIVRAITRWGGENPHKNFARLLMTLLLTLRGTVCIYEGEELNLPEANVPYEKMVDPYGIQFYPKFKGRDGCRTPMPWQHDAKNAGFSSADNTWLPIPKEHYHCAVDLQETDKNSTLNIYRRFLHWRKQQSALITGDIEFKDAEKNLLAFERKDKNKTLLILCNLSDQQTHFDISDYELITEHSYDIKREKNSLKIGPFAAAILKK